MSWTAYREGKVWRSVFELFYSLDIIIRIWFCRDLVMALPHCPCIPRDLNPDRPPRSPLDDERPCYWDLRFGSDVCWRWMATEIVAMLSYR